MNLLVVGDKEPILDHLPDSFLLIDDDVDRIHGKLFDATKHTFNPLKGMDYRRAREFVSVLDAAFPEGQNTLTKKRGRLALLSALLSDPQPTRLNKIFARETEQNIDAYQNIQTILLSPVLRTVLSKSSLFSFKGKVLVRLNRAELGDFDCYILGNLLISQYKGTVILPDFGFYQAPFHTSLIRQNRLIAGINSFDEVPDFQQNLLRIDEKIGKHCTSEDAEILALYAGFGPTITGHANFIKDCMK